MDLLHQSTFLAKPLQISTKVCIFTHMDESLIPIRKAAAQLGMSLGTFQKLAASDPDFPQRVSLPGLNKVYFSGNQLNEYVRSKTMQSQEFGVAGGNDARRSRKNKVEIEGGEAQPGAGSGLDQSSRVDTEGVRTDSLADVEYDDYGRQFDDIDFFDRHPDRKFRARRPLESEGMDGGLIAVGRLFDGAHLTLKVNHADIDSEDFDPDSLTDDDIMSAFDVVPTDQIETGSFDTTDLKTAMELLSKYNDKLVEESRNRVRSNRAAVDQDNKMRDDELKAMEKSGGRKFA